MRSEVQRRVTCLGGVDRVLATSAVGLEVVNVRPYRFKKADPTTDREETFRYKTYPYLSASSTHSRSETDAFTSADSHLLVGAA